MSKRNIETASHFRSQSQKSQQTGADYDGTDFNFDFSVQQLMPLLSSIKQQNEQLKSQKNKIQNDMKLLDKLSKDILNQNKDLRKHYYERTNDLQKITKTIAINAKQQLNDLNHLCHIVRGHNSKMVKVIEQKMSQSKQINGRINNIYSQLQHITTGNINYEEGMRNKEVKVKQLSNRYESLQQKLSSLQSSLQKLESQTNNLILTNHQLKQRNTTIVQVLRRQVYKAQYQRPELQQQSLLTIKNNQHLKIQLKKLEEDLQKFIKVNNQLQRQYNKAHDKVIKIQRQTQRKRIKLAENQRNINQLKQRVKDQQKKDKQLTSQCYNQISKKNQWIEKVNSLKSQTKKKQQKYRKNLENITMEKQHKLAKIKSKIASLDHSFEEQLSLKLNPQIGYAEQRLFQIKEQYNDLITEVQELKQKVASMDSKNTFKEIVKMQYQLKNANEVAEPSSFGSRFSNYRKKFF